MNAALGQVALLLSAISKTAAEASLRRPSLCGDASGDAADDDDAAADAAAARGGGTELRRFSYLGGNFGTPHRDHASSDCFG